MRYVLAVMACAGLAGCEAASTYDARQCSGYGFSPGTPEHANCVMQASQTRAMMFMGAQRPYVAPVAVAPVTPAPAQVRCQNFGGVLRCY